MTNSPAAILPGARKSLALLLAINLFCYLDRYILAAVIPDIKETFLAGEPDANSKAGLLTTAFLLSYMLTAPLFGWLADRYSRWMIIGFSVALWSLACGASGLATGFVMLLLTRVFLGVGEAGYGPAAPTIISDFYPVEKRGQVLAWFFMAIPVGSALGYAFGGLMSGWLGWRWAFYLVVPPGILLALLCFFMKEPRRESASSDAPKPGWEDYKKLLRIPSLVTNILAQAAMTFAIGGLSVWAPTYLYEDRGVPKDQASLIFGGILAGTGLVSTLLGGWLGDKLRPRYPGSYFLVSGCGMLLAFPATIIMLYVPMPYAWIFIALAMFFLFLNIGPSNTAIANVTPPSMRATAFAANILLIHLLGDVPSPYLMGLIKDRGWLLGLVEGRQGTWADSFTAVSLVMLVAGVVWICSQKSLVRDTERASAAAE
ncbi:MAG TPA: MFS transporter [Chthoniobacterales bacterium]|jgi:MFS family permease